MQLATQLLYYAPVFSLHPAGIGALLEYLRDDLLERNQTDVRRSALGRTDEPVFIWGILHGLATQDAGAVKHPQCQGPTAHPATLPLFEGFLRRLTDPALAVPVVVVFSLFRVELNG